MEQSPQKLTVVEYEAQRHQLEADIAAAKEIEERVSDIRRAQYHANEEEIKFFFENWLEEQNTPFKVNHLSINSSNFELRLQIEGYRDYPELRFENRNYSFRDEHTDVELTLKYSDPNIEIGKDEGTLLANWLILLGKVGVAIQENDYFIDYCKKIFQRAEVSRKVPNVERPKVPSGVLERQLNALDQLWQKQKCLENVCFGTLLHIGEKRSNKRSRRSQNEFSYLFIVRLTASKVYYYEITRKYYTFVNDQEVYDDAVEYTHYTNWNLSSRRSLSQSEFTDRYYSSHRFVETLPVRPTYERWNQPEPF